jgi:hypothetical protein
MRALLIPKVEDTPVALVNHPSLPTRENSRA